MSLTPLPLPTSLQSDALAVELYAICLAQFNNGSWDTVEEADAFWDQPIMDKFGLEEHIEPVGALFGWV